MDYNENKNPRILLDSNSRYQFRDTSAFFHSGIRTRTKLSKEMQVYMHVKMVFFNT